jgi:hypothetical protein
VAPEQVTVVPGGGVVAPGPAAGVHAAQACDAANDAAAKAATDTDDRNAAFVSGDAFRT